MMTSRHEISISIVLLVLAIASCSAKSETGGTGGAGGAAVSSSSSSGKASSSSASSSSTASSSSASSSSAASSSSGCPGMSSSSSGGVFPCSPSDPICNTVASECIALVDNAALKPFTVRVSQLDLTKPPALTNPLFKGVVSSSVTMNLPQCNLGGTGTFNLLLTFDAAASMLTFGGAHPTMAPAQGYKFVNGVYQGLTVAPVTTGMTVNTCNFSSAAAGFDVNLPIYLQPQDPAPAIILPMRKAVVSGTISLDNNCIGKYNADKLDPKMGCAGTDANPAFTDGASLDGNMLLEDADTIIIAPLGQSLCVLLTGDAATYGDGGSPMKCKRDANNQIVFKGDWCNATNMPASGACFDASRLQANLAASAVTLLP